jgi:hypothetical protein
MEQQNKEDQADKIIYQYLQRGCDIEILREVDLINTVGYSLKINPRIPRLQSELEDFQYGRYCYYTTEQIKLFKHILDQIDKTSNRIDKTSTLPIKLTVIPVVLFDDKVIHEIPLFSIKKREITKYVDTVGRAYKDFDDWIKNNRLPTGRVAYPAGGVLRMRGKQFKISYMDTGMRDTRRKYILGINVVFSIIGSLFKMTRIPAAIYGNFNYHVK